MSCGRVPHDPIGSNQRRQARRRIDSGTASRYPATSSTRGLGRSIANHTKTAAPATHTGTTGASDTRRCRIRIGSGSSSTVKPVKNRKIDPNASGIDITNASHSAHGWRSPGAVGGSGDPGPGSRPRDDVLPLRQDERRQLTGTPGKPTTPQVHPRSPGERRRQRDGFGDREHDPLPTIERLQPLLLHVFRFPHRPIRHHDDDDW